MKMKNLITLGLAVSIAISAMNNIVFAANSGQTISDSAGTITVNPIDTTYVSQHGDDANTNFHDSDNMMVNYTNRTGGNEAWGQYGYMKFDIGDLDRERIISAKLRVYVENAGDKSSSVRTIGIYDTCESEWDGSEITWSAGKSEANTLLGSFTVTADGYNITDYGWREIDVTDFLQNGIDTNVSLMAKMTSVTGYRVAITSGTYSNARDNMPELVIECSDAESPNYTRTYLSPTRDTHIEQNGSNGYTNYIDSEYLKVNYTSDESRSDFYGSYSYMDFDMGEINQEEISTAKLWIYVDGDSDKRNSTRTIGVFAPATAWSSSITWWNGRVAASGDTVGSFAVSGNGFYITNPGWRSVDITEYIKSLASSNISLTMKTIEGNAHPVVIRSDDYNDEATRPKLEIRTEKPSELSANYKNGIITIKGSVGINDEKEVLIRVFKPDGSLEVIDQITSDESGCYDYTYTITDAPNGTYQVLASIEGDENVRRTKFYVGCTSEINPIYLDEVSTMTKPTVYVSSSSTYLRNDYKLTIYSRMTPDDRNTEEQNITTVIAQYNSDGTMRNYLASSIKAEAGGLENMGSDVILPSDVTGMRLKVFTLEGTSIYTSRMIPLSNPYCLTDQEPTTGGGFSLMSVVDEEDPLFINDVVFPEYADQFSVYDISYYYGQEKSYYEKIILPGKTLTINGKVKNKKTTATKIGEAFYTQQDGQANYVELSTWYTIRPGETREVSWDVPSEWTAYPPESDPVYPSNWISDEGGLTTEHHDYFGNNIKESVLVDKDNFIKGKIDDTGDIDCVKFVVDKDGYYEVSQLNGVQLTGQMYAENLIDTDDPLNGFEQKISSVTPNENLLWGGYLTGGNTYAMKLVPETAGATGDYTCAISVDTDGDGLPDVWESTGDIDGDGTIDIEGADPYKTDVFVEINWMTGYKPEQDALDYVADVFANTEAGYLKKGINLHNIWGEEKKFVEVMRFIDEEDYTDIDEVLLPYFTKKIREHAYHCALFGNKYAPSSAPENTGSSGYSAYEWGQTLFIAMGFGESNDYVMSIDETASTYMHELGHNLGLKHGGNEIYNNKPNYLSIMNYAFQFDGLEGTYRFTYSDTELPTLDENNLIEADGFDKECKTSEVDQYTYVACFDEWFGPIAGRPYDYNKDDDCDDVSLAYDLNCDGNYSLLTGHDDWSSLIFNQSNIGKRFNKDVVGMTLLSTSPQIAQKEMTYEEYLSHKKH